MDIPNLAPNSNTNINANNPLKLPKEPKIAYFVVILLAILFGFLISRVLPTQTSVTDSLVDSQNSTKAVKLSEGDEVKVGVTYGNLSKNFSDSAMGVVKVGGINNEGTHTLIREGGVTQNAALTSSTIDLDLFVDKKVEVKGETNDSNKVGWFMDVGSIKILE